MNKKTGETYYQSDMTGLDEFPRDCNGEDYIEIPHKNDLGLGRDLVFDFVAAHLPQELDEVYQMFRSKGAYSRFKYLLDSNDLPYFPQVYNIYYWNYSAVISMA